MPTRHYANIEIDVDDDGFLIDPSVWTDEVARDIAREAGIEELTDSHWAVVRFMRDRFLQTGTAPAIRTLSQESGVSTRDLYKLFPKGPAKLAARIAGIPKPDACI